MPSLEQQILNMLNPITEEKHIDLGPALVKPTDSLPDYSKSVNKMPVPTTKPSDASSETGSMKSSSEGDNKTAAAKSIEMKGSAAAVVKEENKEKHEDEAEDKKLIKKMMDKKEKEEDDEEDEDMKEAYSEKSEKSEKEDEDEDDEDKKNMKEEVETILETQTFTITFKKGTSTVKTAVVTALDKGEAKRKANEMKKSTPSLKGTSAIISMKEETYFDTTDLDLSELFTEETELSEDFKTKATTIFESAVNVKVAEKVSEIKEEYNTKLVEATAKIQETVESTVNMYLDYVVENFMKENELAIVNGLKNELFEDFFSGLKSLFETHNISIPEEKIDIAEKAVSELEEANIQLDNLMTENAKLSEEITSLKKNNIVSEAIEGLTLTDRELLVSLSETVEFTTEEEFRKKLNILREAHCNKKEATETKVVMEDVITPSVVEENNIDPSMKRYMDVISRTSK